MEEQEKLGKLKTKLQEKSSIDLGKIDLDITENQRNIELGSIETEEPVIKNINLGRVYDEPVEDTGKKPIY
jgi:hypothetical protein